MFLLTLLFRNNVLLVHPFLRDSNLYRVWHIGESVEIYLSFWFLPTTESSCKAFRYQHVYMHYIGVSWVIPLCILFEKILGLRALLNSFLLVAEILPPGICITINYFVISFPNPWAMLFYLWFLSCIIHHTLGIGAGIMLFSCYYSIGGKRQILVYSNQSQKERKNWWE